MNQILRSTQFVIKNSKYVVIDRGAVKQAAKNFSFKSFKHWLLASPVVLPKLPDNELLHFLLLLNSLSFCYWSEPKWTVMYRNQTLDGAWAMIAVLVRAVNRDCSFLDFKKLYLMSDEEVTRLFRGNTDIPMLRERIEILKEITSQLVRKYNGQFFNVISQAHSAKELLETIIQVFPSFDDVSLYKGETIYFYKRAQLLVADIHHLFKLRNKLLVRDIDKLTACADYKLPAVLRKMNILKYSSALKQKIDNKIELTQGSEEEIEVRATTIWAVEYLRHELCKLHPQKNINAHEINDYLWLLSQNKNNYQAPYHLTKTIYY